MYIGGSRRCDARREILHMHPEQLDIWIERAVTVNSAADMFFDADPK